MAVLTQVQRREILDAEKRWAFCVSCVEPVIRQASNSEEDDDTVNGLLPNHEDLIRSADKALLIVKCRKIAHSWGIALKCYSRAVTKERSTSIIGSYDEEEAKEKREFLDWIDKSMDLTEEGRWVRSLVSMGDGTEVVKFSNGSRIKFSTRKAPTGPGSSVEWDEFSLEPPGRATAAQILAGALGCTTHGGTVSLGGTERGPETLFHKIVSGEHEEEIKKNPMLQRMAATSWKVFKHPWWSSPALCKNVELAKQMAPLMPTEDRVEMFGNDKLQAQFVTYCTTPDLGLDIFQREFEMMVLDDKESYYTLDLIRSCYPGPLEDYWFTSAEIEGANYYAYGPETMRRAFAAIDALEAEIKFGRLRGEWGLSMDIGRDRDRDEIWIGHTDARNPRLLNPRLCIGADLLPFPGKTELLDYIYWKIPIMRGYIDGTKGSVGRQFSEECQRKWGMAAQAFVFDQSSKQILASGLKMRMETREIKLPPKTSRFERLENQMLKVKKLQVGQGVVFDVERNKNQHGDCFWSMAMLAEVFKMPWVRDQGPNVQILRGRPVLALPAPPKPTRARALPPGHSIPLARPGSGFGGRSRNRM